MSLTFSNPTSSLTASAGDLQGSTGGDFSIVLSPAASCDVSIKTGNIRMIVLDSLLQVYLYFVTAPNPVDG